MYGSILDAYLTSVIQACSQNQLLWVWDPPKVNPFGPKKNGFILDARIYIIDAYLNSVIQAFSHIFYEHGTPQKVDLFWTQKVDFLNFTALSPST